MPIYEYNCPHCHKNFEEWLKADDDASSHPCPTCGASSPRIISQTTFILKGGGWYVTEYGPHHAEGEDATRESTADTPAAEADAPSQDASRKTPKDTSPEAAGETPGGTKAEAKAEARHASAAPEKSAATPAPQTAPKAAPSTSEAKTAKPAVASA